MKEPMNKKINNPLNHPTILMHKTTSPNKFKLDGEDILHTLNKNHHKHIPGYQSIEPLFIRKLRPPKCS